MPLSEKAPIVAEGEANELPADSQVQLMPSAYASTPAAAAETQHPAARLQHSCQQTQRFLLLRRALVAHHQEFFSTPDVPCFPTHPS